ncbi:CU044_5270 family protein [Streptomyces sp. NPDC018031]|uniref:CU044_5270 family protein n=1 Tax=Streptomyces sp. NPDC018031 TaxID=3365033 RepID=UPI0037AAA9E5
MDELQAVRDMRPSAPEPGVARLAQGRRDLLAAAAAADGPDRGRAPRWLTGSGRPWRLAIPAAVAASVVAGLLAVTPGDQGAAREPQARTVNVAQVMERAADSVRDHKVTRPRSDQWIYNKTAVRTPRYFEDEGWERYDGKQYAYRRHGKIVVVDDTPSAGHKVEGPKSYEQWYDDIVKLPTDPRKLLARVHSDASFDTLVDTFLDEKTGPPKALDFRRLSNILSYGVALPPELNAALYRALALVPGVEVLEQRVDDAAGRSSLAVRYVHRGPGKDTADYLFLDPETYAFRGTGWDATRLGPDPRFEHELAALVEATVDKPGETR